MWTSLLPNSGRNGYGQAAFTICEPDGQVKFSVCYRQLGIADTGSFWSLRSDKQMDVKLFTEFLQKKKMIHQKTWLLWKTHFPHMVQSKIFENSN